jgi:CarD family transcriptional regulator
LFDKVSGWFQAGDVLIKCSMVINTLAGEVSENSGLSFSIGDLAVYPGQGVAEVLDIREMFVNQQTQLFYVFLFLKTDRKVLIPVENLDEIGVRRVITEDDVAEIFQLLTDQSPIDLDHKAWHRRYKDFIDKMRSGSAFDVAEVCRDLAFQARGRTLSFGERQVLTRARALLAKEIALVRQQTEEQISQQIGAIIGV